MGCNDAVLPNPLLKNCTINCITIEENTRQPYNDNRCLYCPFVLHLHKNQQLEEETAKIFNLFMIRMDRLSHSQFQEVYMNDVPTVEDLLLLKNLRHDIYIVKGHIVGELAWRSVQNHKKL